MDDDPRYLEKEYDENTKLNYYKLFYRNKDLRMGKEYLKLKVRVEYDENRNTFNENIESWINDQFGEDKLSLSTGDARGIHSVSVNSVNCNLSRDYNIVDETDNLIRIEARANITYDVSITIDSHNGSFYDDEDEVWYFVETEDVKEQDNINITIRFVCETPQAGEQFAELVIEAINDKEDLNIRL